MGKLSLPELPMIEGCSPSLDRYPDLVGPFLITAILALRFSSLPLWHDRLKILFFFVYEGSLASPNLSVVEYPSF